MPEYPEDYEISRSIDSLGESSDFEGVNCFRIAIASLFFEGRSAYINELIDQIREVGIANVPTPEENLTEFRYKDSIEKREIAATLSRYSDQTTEINRDAVRKALWLEIIENPTRSSALFAFTANTLYSALERESLISAIALMKAVPLLNNGWHVSRTKVMFRRFAGHPLLRGLSLSTDINQSLRDIVLSVEVEVHDFQVGDWISLCNSVGEEMSRGTGLTRYLSGIVFLSHIRLIHAKFSTDDFSRDVVNATFVGKSVEEDPTVNLREGVDLGVTGCIGETLSTIVHGTFAHQTAWWRPGGDFFDFAKNSFSPELYSGNYPVTWKGFPSFRNLRSGARNLEAWYEQVWSPKRLKTIFTHSYGGDIVARAILGGMPVDELILLSATVTDPLIDAIPLVPRVVDIRIHFDFVLWVAGVYQKLPGHLSVDRIPYTTHFWRHSCTHDVEYWKQQRTARRIWPRRI